MMLLSEFVATTTGAEVEEEDCAEARAARARMDAVDERMIMTRLVVECLKLCVEEVLRAPWSLV